MSGIEVARDEMVLVPDRWSKSGWKWRQRDAPKPYFQHRGIETYKDPAAPTTVGPAHQGLVPTRWSPTGWKFVPADYQPKVHPNTRNFDRRSGRPRNKLNSSFTTTTQAFFSDPSPRPVLEQHQRYLRKGISQFPPLPMDVEMQKPRHRKQLSEKFYSPQKERTQTLGGLLGGEEKKETAIGWAGINADPRPGGFNKRKQHYTEWTEMLLSGGTIH